MITKNAVMNKVAPAFMDFAVDRDVKLGITCGVSLMIWYHGNIKQQKYLRDVRPLNLLKWN